MKNALSILAFVLLLTALPAAAQNYPVRVTSDGAPVPYAYVLVGDAVQAMTDAEGRATIRRGIEPGEVLSARFVGMDGIPLKWDGSLPESGIIELRLTPNAIEAVTVSARGRDRSRQFFRRYVDKIPIHGWNVGFTGGYMVRLSSDQPWTARGKYRRDHIKGEDVNSLEADTNNFTLTPAADSDSPPMWQLQRYLLMAKGIAERAVQFNEGLADRGLILQYKGRDTDGRNMFLVVKPYYDRFSDREESFQTLIHVSEQSGVIYSSQTVSQSRYGIWNVSATYAAYSPTGRSADRFIYPVMLDALFEERTMLAEFAEQPTTVDVELRDIAPYRIAPPASTVK